MCGLFFSRRGTPRAYMMHCREAVSLALLLCAPMRLADYKRLLTGVHQASRNLASGGHHAQRPSRIHSREQAVAKRVNEAINRRDYYQECRQLHNM